MGLLDDGEDRVHVDVDELPTPTTVENPLVLELLLVCQLIQWGTSNYLHRRSIARTCLLDLECTWGSWSSGH